MAPTKEKPKRRMLAVSVDEVSLVDRAANKKKFLLRKREADDPEPTQEEQDMAAFKGKGDGKQAGAEENVNKDAGAEQAAAEGATNDTDTGEDGGDTDTGEDGGTEGGTTTVDQPDDAGTEGGEQAEVTKADPPTPTADDMLDTLVTHIQKGKTFTPKRVAGIKSTIVSLAGLLADVDKAGYKDVMKTLKAMPEGKGLASGTMAVPTKKGAQAEGDDTPATEDGPSSELAEVLKGIKELGGKLDKVTKRVDDIEGERQPSQSVEDDPDSEGTDQPVKKSNLWSGVV